MFGSPPLSHQSYRTCSLSILKDKSKSYSIKLASLGGQFLQKVGVIRPIADLVSLLNVLFLDSFEHFVGVVFGRWDVFNSDNTLQHNVRLRVSMGIDHAWTIDEIDALHERDVLPDLGLSRDRRHIAHFLLPQSVDYTALSCVRISGFELKANYQNC